MALRIDWEGLIVAFESRSHKITHFFDRETGDVEQVLESDRERHEAISADPRFAALPRDGGERSVGDLEEFLSRCEDEACRRDLRAALDAAGSVSLYRETLMRYPIEEARFFHFKERQALERAQDWLTEMAIPFRAPNRPA
jgi:hypothetical protein